MTLSPEAAARVAAYGQARAARAAAGVPVRAPAVPGTRAFTLEAVGPGWRITSRSRRFADTFDSPINGICVETVHDQHIDEWGEITPTTRYRTLTTWAPATPWHVIDSADVDLDALDGIDRTATTGAIKWLLRPVCADRHIWLRPHHADAIVDAFRSPRPHRMTPCWELKLPAGLRPTKAGWCAAVANGRPRCRKGTCAVVGDDDPEAE